MAKAKKPVHELELDEQEESATEYAYAQCMTEVSEILSRAYEEIGTKVRTLLDEVSTED